MQFLVNIPYDEDQAWDIAQVDLVDHLLKSYDGITVRYVNES